MHIVFVSSQTQSRFNNIINCKLEQNSLYIRQRSACDLVEYKNVCYSTYPQQNSESIFKIYRLVAVRARPPPPLLINDQHTVFISIACAIFCYDHPFIYLRSLLLIDIPRCTPATNSYTKMLNNYYLLPYPVVAGYSMK